MRPISHEKETHLGKICMTKTDLMVKFYEKSELGDVICAEFSNSSGKTIKANLEGKQWVLKPPMQLRIFNQISDFNVEKWILKNKINVALPAQYFTSFQGKKPEVLYFIVSVKLCISKDMDKGNYIFDVLDYNTVTWRNCDDDTITQYTGFPMNVYDDLSIE